MSSALRLNRSFGLLIGTLLMAATGCAHLPAIPVSRLPQEYLAQPKTELQTISYSALRQDTPENYLLGPGDVLGVFIETVTGAADVVPPVHFTDDKSAEPAIGFPIPIREDGTISLPLVRPFKVEGLNLAEAATLIERKYTVDNKLLPEGKERILVSLLRKRHFRILVVRADGVSEDAAKKSKSGRKRGSDNFDSDPSSAGGFGFAIDLPKYENDLLHALNETGGLPGTEAQNEIVIYKGGFQDAVERDRMIEQMNATRDPCQCKLPPPDGPNVIRVPIRFYPGERPRIEQEDIILADGDIVVIESRDEERFYTAGAIPGGSFLLPRDYDINVLQAISLAGGNIGSSGLAAGSSNRGVFGGSGFGYAFPPTRITVLRRTCTGGQIPIRIDINKALRDPGQQIIIQPEDTILVQFTPAEEIGNLALRVLNLNFVISGQNLGFN